MNIYLDYQSEVINYELNELSQAMITIIEDYKELIHERLDLINTNNNNNNILVTKCYKKINSNIKKLIRLQTEYNYCYHQELMSYFYNPHKVYQFLLNHPNKHVEDMYN